MTVYRIAKWDTVFERAESRKLKQLNWVAVPIGFTSNGYQSLLDEFEDRAAAIYGCWCALVAVAASCSVRGVLGTSRGNPLKISHIARMTGFQSTDFDSLIAWASSAHVGWLEVLSDDDVASIFRSDQQKPTESDCSGDSPDDPPRSQVNPPSTQQDITRHNKTISAAACAAAADKFKELDPEEITRLANRLRKVAPTLPLPFVWQTVCVGEVLSSGMISEVCTRLSAGDVRKPRSYIETALRKEAEKIDLDWKALLPMVPKPKLKETAGV